MVTVASACRHAHMLSPQPCLQEQVRIQTWATVKRVLVLLPVLGLTWLVGMLVHLSPAWAYAAVGLNSFRVRSALQRMTEKKTTEAFTACSSPMGPGSRLRFLGPWEVAQDNPVALVPARRHLAVRGTRSPRIPTTFSSIAEPERPAVELTSIQGAQPPGRTPPRVPILMPRGLKRLPNLARRRWEQERQRRLRAQVTAPLSLLNGFLERVRADLPPGSAWGPLKGPTRGPCGTDGLCLSLALARCQRCCAPPAQPPNFVQDCCPHTLPPCLEVLTAPWQLS
ncbi:hypothetical protein GH733_011246 [Mirounga leonina]|nr:hypothetical protein GH733_011246 [Mirounga leonina]